MGKPRKPLAARIRDEISRRGWSAYYVAKETGVPYMTVRRFVLEAHTPTLATIEKILDLLDWEVAPRTRSKP